MENISKELLEKLVRQIIEEKLAGAGNNDSVDFIRNKDKSGIMSIKLPTVKVDESNRLDTGNPRDVVYTKDLFTLEESPRLGAGIIDYIIEGHLDIIIDGRKISADAGEIILIPKGSKIQFSVPDYARFIYVTYPADWASQA